MTKKEKRTSLYVYTNETNKSFALKYGKARYGSASEYVDHLIASDRKRLAATRKANAARAA